MHTFPGRWTRSRIHHNGDYSGEAIVTDGTSEVTVPCDLLLSFAAEFVRTKKIAELEQMEAAQLLGVDKLTL